MLLKYALKIIKYSILDNKNKKLLQFIKHKYFIYYFFQ